MLELIVKPLSEIPIKRLDRDQQKPFIDFADRILAAKESDPDADTTAFEGEIDLLIYDLYGLTPKEKVIVKELTRARDS